MTDTAAARRRPGPARTLSRDQVIATALDVMATSGLKSVGFRSVALRLGVDPKALYTYVEDKDDLLAGMLEAAITRIDLPQPDDERTPVEQVVAFAVSMRASFLANIDLFHLAPAKMDVQAGMSASQDVWSMMLKVSSQPAAAAELYTNLVQLAVGSAIETARYERSQERRRAVVAELERTGTAEQILAAHAMQAVDRSTAFEALVRRILG